MLLLNPIPIGKTSPKIDISIHLMLLLNLNNKLRLIFGVIISIHLMLLLNFCSRNRYYVNSKISIHLMLLLNPSK